MQDALIADEKYSGKYVIIEGLDNPSVISSGSDPNKVRGQQSQGTHNVTLSLNLA